MGHPDTPLFVKTHDFNLWLFQQAASILNRNL
jgi:hypothetical protein